MAPPRGGLPRRLKPLVFILCLVPLATLAWDTYAGNLGGFPIEQTEIRTGRWALRFLLITLSITPLRRFTGWNWLIGYRRMLGLFVFFYATVHLAMYIGLDFFFDWKMIAEDVFEHRYVYIGVLTYILLIPLAITSTKGWIRRLGRRWQKLHRLVYVALVTALLHYLWAVKAISSISVFYVVVAVLLLGWRIWAWKFAGRTRRTRAPAEVTSSLDAAHSTE